MSREGSNPDPCNPALPPWDGWAQPPHRLLSLLFLGELLLGCLALSAPLLSRSIGRCDELLQVLTALLTLLLAGLNLPQLLEQVLLLGYLREKGRRGLRKGGGTGERGLLGCWRNETPEKGSGAEMGVMGLRDRLTTCRGHLGGMG